MSAPKLITPLLANHIMGESISDHHGVCCCPAILKDSDRKYIVKIISVPAYPRQLDALLLSGAYANKEEALVYFRELATEVEAEAKLLQKLSKLEGFACYDSWQTVAMDDGNGYNIYLLSEYGLTLERHMRRNCLTHLAAVNLGLDLCAALSVSRRNGYLYVDLKPENIIITENKDYLIGDLGFVSLASLKYASLADKYRSRYTAPEIQDAYSTLNDTMDIYALGLVLYQVFNNGQLPDEGEPILPPAYADYEMSEIILKACAEDPADRWQDPQQMGQALVSYMQRNTVNDTPIIPPPVAPAPEPPVEVPEEPAVEEITDESTEAEPVVEESPEEPTEQEPVVEEIQEELAEEEPVVEESPEEPAEQEPVVEESPEEPAEQEPVVEESPEEPAEEESYLLDSNEEDEDVDIATTSLSDELSAMLAQADELIAHQTPGGVVAPEPIELQIPELILPLPEEPEAEESQDLPADAEPETEPEPVSEEEIPMPAPVVAPKQILMDEELEDDEDFVEKKRRPIGCIIAILLSVLILAGALLGGNYYYENYYLQNINTLTLSGEEDYLIVSMNTMADNSLLTVYCTDTYGNTQSQKVVNNRAVFSNLPSGTSYRITVTIDGFHKLTGETTATYTTATQTNIVNFSAITGDTDGSVILNFSVQGPDDSAWKIRYSAPGEAEQVISCSGHMAIITGLKVDKLYTFRLESSDGLYVVGNHTLNFTTARVVFAQNLAIHGFDGGMLVATWDAPEGIAVDSWIVRCYNSAGFDTTITVTEPGIRIPGLDISQSYTLDVKANGMTVSRWTSISANSITFKDILIDSSDPAQLTITWPFEGTVPEGGWQLQYTVDGSEPVVIPCEKNTCTITNLVPGSRYKFSFVLPDGISVFGGTAEHSVPDVTVFNGYGVSASDMIISMCKAPDKLFWTWQDVPQDAYTTSFASGEKAGIVLNLIQEYKTSPDLIQVRFIIRTESGSPVSFHTVSQSWTNLWYQGYCELDLPQLPEDSGTYQLEIYFNGAYVTLNPIIFTVS